ncbi:SixA phosphatase family protein [Flavobacterium sp.]|uniref:SixA phosphatase family protein n=1 Tax=Flavobacterium sp. TaxID=239 RepID=UPI003D6B0247
MKSLILIRHAKSSWDFPVIDKERPLIESGVKNIKKVAKKAIEFLPENRTIWSSTANRATQTALLFCENTFMNQNDIIFKDSLYTFDGSKLENEIRKCENTIENLILFGHNEAITNIVNKFGDKFIMNVPTAGFVYLQFEQNNWQNISKGKTIKFIFPKEITE